MRSRELTRTPLEIGGDMAQFPQRHGHRRIELGIGLIDFLT
jgi:hypothetical protein